MKKRLLMLIGIILILTLGGYTISYAACEHPSYYSEIEEPTCYYEGSKTEICSSCGEVLNVWPISMLPHMYYNREEIEATCVDWGEVREYCVQVGCGEYRVVETIPPTGDHDYSSYISEYPTCIDYGTRTYECVNCSDSYDVDISPSSNYHDWGPWTSVSDWLDERYCDICGEREVYVYECDHDYYESDYYAGDCKNKSWTEYTCSNCGDYYYSYGSTGDHKWSVTSSSAGDCQNKGWTKYTCSVCKTTKTTTGSYGSHNYANACTSCSSSKQRCSICSTTKTHTVAVPSVTTSFAYDGTNKSPLASTSYYTLSNTSSAKNAGDYTVSVSLSNTSIHTWSTGGTAAKTYSWSISPKSVAVSWGSETSFEYDGNSHAPTASASSGITGETLQISRTTAIEAGTHTSTATLSSVTGGVTSNYTLTNTTKQFTINKLAIPIPTQNGTLTYDQTNQTPSWNNYNTTYMTLGGTTSGTNAGSYNATFTLKDTANTTWSDGATAAKNMTWTISQYDLSNATIASISAQTYTGSGISPTPSVTVVFVETTILTTNDFTYSYANNTVVGKATLTVTGKGNYKGTKTAEFVISARPITVKAGSSSKKYDGQPLTNTSHEITAGSLATGHNITTSISGTITNVGSVTNTLNSVKITDGSGTDVTSNYVVTKVNGTLAITSVDSANFEVTLEYTNTKYDGSIKKPSVVVKLENKTLVAGYDYDVNYSANKNAGKATVIINGIGNYENSYKAVEFTITTRELEVTAGSASKIYDGTPLTSTSYSITAGSLAPGDLMTATTRGSITNAGITDNSIETINIYNADGNAISNYDLTLKKGTLEVISTIIEGSVTIKGENRVGQILNAEVEASVANYTTTYKWHVSDTNSMTGGTLITSETTESFVVTEDMLDKYIYVEATVSTPGYIDSIFKDVTDSVNNGYDKVSEAYASILKEETEATVYTNKYIFGNSSISQRRNNIGRIIIQNNMYAPTGATVSFDVSKEQNKSVMVWLVPNGSMYDLYIGGNKGVIASSGSYLFANYTNCTSITGLEYLDTFEVTDVKYMFADDSSLTNLAIEDIQVDFAGDMSYMFKNCSALTSLDMSNFKTLRATNMKGMFSGCSKLTSLDVLGFSTGNVTDMSGMFENCSELETIDVSRFYTINVTNMASMFAGCSKVSKLDLLNFNTSKVKSVGKMFKDCDALVNLDLSRFDLRSLDGSTYYKEDGNKDINQVEMFNGCSNLYTMVLGKNFARLDGVNMFTGCNALVSIIAQSTNAMTLGTTTGLNSLANAVLYVPKASVEASYEGASNYLSVFGANRVKPMIEVIGDNPVYAELYKEYTDAGAKIAGFDKANENEYKKYGYSLIVENADVDTSKLGTTTVIYKLKYFDSMIDIFEQ